MASLDGASPEAPSENMAEEKYLRNILSPEEINAIPETIACKIETHYNAKLEELFTSNALSEAGRREASEKADKFEEQLKDLSSKYEEYKSKFEASEETLRELESQLAATKEELLKTSESLKKAEFELDDIKNDRCSAVVERDSLSSMLERREGELKRLNIDMVTLTSQLEKAINDKCEILTKSNEIQNKEFTLNFKEQHMEQEKLLLMSEIKGLNNQLNARNDELQTMGFTLSQKILQLEAMVQGKSEELKMSRESVNNLNEVNKTLRSKNEMLIQKLLDQHDLEESMVRNYKSEIETKTKLADLYKSMQEDAEAKCTELANGVTELQKLLSESVDKYGELETKYKQLESDHEEMIEKKNSTIASMKKELENANELLQGAKGSSISQVLEKISPLGGAAGRFLHANMTMTQLYTQLTDVADELAKEKEENRRVTEALTNVFSELRVKAPMFEELQNKYEEALEVNGSISRQLELVMAEHNGLTDEYNQTVRRSNHFQKENEKVKRELEDLSRQVCYLLREIEMTKGGSIPNGDKDGDVQPDNLNSSELISRHLVTFSDIQELQNNNQKLLRTIRELTDKQEEKEKKESELNLEEMQKKYDTLEEKIKEMVEERNKMVKMVENVVKQRDMYKKQCGIKKGDTSFDKSDISEELSKSHSKSVSEESSALNKTAEDEALKKQLHDIKTQLDKKIEEHRIYKEESQGNQKMLMQQIENMRKEMNEVTCAYSKAAVQLEFLNEKQNALQLNITTYKKQIASLEEQNKSYSVTIGKSEQSMMHIRQEAANAQSRLIKCEAQVQSLVKEVQLLRSVEAKLTTERDSLIKEKQGQGLLLNNLEMIKASLERVEGDSRVKLESRLDDANREIIAMRRTLLEEQTRFREFTSLLQKQTDEAKAKMEDEKSQANILREELNSLREKLKNNAGNLEDITIKFPSTSTMFDSSVDLAKKVKDLEGLLHSKLAELKYSQQELEVSKERVRQYCDISQEAEMQLQVLNTQFEELKTSSEQKINNLLQSESELKERCSELEAELSIQTDGQHISSSELKIELAKTVEKLETLQRQLNEKHVALGQAQAEALRLSVSTQQAEEKYAQEVILHSNDIQALTEIKEKLAALQQDLAELQNSKEQALHNLEENKQAWTEQEKTLNAEKEELQSRFADLNQQNSLLLDQVQALSTKLSLATVKQSDNLNESANTSLMGDTSLNRSVNEDEVKSSEKLVQIIKFLRKERDIIVAKFDILQTENIRLKSQLDITDKKLDEAKLSLALERQKSEENSMTSSKHSELLRKVEQLNSISDSNRVLREERETLIAKVNQLTELVSKLEESLAPLQEQNLEISCKLELCQSENSSLKTEVGRWRTRVSTLMGSVKETRFEDLRKLQNEKESLSKVISSEREVFKKFNEEATTVKSEKIKLEEQIQVLNRQHIAQTEQYKKQIEELSTLKKEFTRVTQELEQTKTSLNEKSNEVAKLTEGNNEKEATINDLRNKEAQIRKIAKKYKAQFEDLTKSVEDDKNKRDQEAAVTAESAEGQMEANKELESKISDMERLHSEKLAELEAKITMALGETDALKTENETLKVTTSEKEEKAKQVLKQAKTKIMQLTDANEKLTRQLSDVKGSMESAEQNKEESDTRFELLTSQYETRLSRAEKEKNEALQEKQQEIQRLNKEIESLNQRVSQLQKQVGTGAEAASATVTPTPTPTANIKPMAAHSAGSHCPQAARRGETPFASIRPMASSGTRTAAVLPSPSSSGHSTEYMPASSSARGSSRPTPQAPDSPPHPPQALVLPRVEEGPGSQPPPPSQPTAHPPRPSLKRKPQHSHKSSQQTKRTKVQQGQVTESHCETEYQVPTSSQRDHDDDEVILVVSEDDGEEEQHYEDNYQEGDDDEEDEDEDEEIGEEEEEDMEEEDEDVEEEDGEEGEGMGDEEDDETEDPEGVAEEEEEGDVEAEEGGEEEEEGRGQEDEEGDMDEEQQQEHSGQSECEVGASSEASVSPQDPSGGVPPTSTTTTSTTQHSDAQQSQQTHTVSSGTQE